VLLEEYPPAPTLVLEPFPAPALPIILEVERPAQVRANCSLCLDLQKLIRHSLVINNCTNGINNCAPTGSTCNNLGPGSFSCTCNSGYNGTGTTCTPINHCANGDSTCATGGVSTCTYTTPGLYTCACISGYSGNGQTCTFINNCTGGGGGTNTCSSNALCTSTGAGTYSCACNTNYTGNGVICTGMS